MKEWNNPYNSFNSFKVLMWREQLEAIVRQDFLPPVTVDTDPSNKCNYDCIWCNALDCMGKIRQNIEETHLLKLADFYKEWGIHSTCVAGGGEPFCNPATPKFLLALQERNIQAGVITNGSLLDDEKIEVLSKTCRWVGFSMDAATSDTYLKVKGIQRKETFDKVIENISKLCSIIKSNSTGCDVCYKFLLHPYNAGEIYEATVIAKQLGVNDFQIRPVGWDNISKTLEAKPLNFEPIMSSIDEQIEKALKLEGEHFHVYGIRHKFNPMFKRKVNFKRCWALPLLLTFGADGNCHLCFDMRGNKNLILCSHTPDPHEVLKHWNGERHKNILRNICVNDCPRCTFGIYNEIIENVFLKDGMCKYFP